MEVIDIHEMLMAGLAQFHLYHDTEEPDASEVLSFHRRAASLITKEFR